MLVHVTWQQSSAEAALHTKLETPTRSRTTTSRATSKEHGATVKEWKPLNATRRADPAATTRLLAVLQRTIR